MRTARAERRRLVALARKTLRERAPWANEPGHCLVAAWATCMAGAAVGRRLQLFAGSAHWVCQERPERVHFGYEWTGGQVLVPGALPEVHCWAGDPVSGEFIDITLPWWPEQAKRLGGLDWTADRPEVLFAPHDALPAAADYRPTLEAGRYAQARLVELVAACGRTA